MAVNSVNILRVTSNLRTTSVLDSLRRNQLGVFEAQTKISSNRAFVKPSDDPVAASRATTLNQTLLQQNQLIRNLGHADSVLNTTDSTISEINTLLIEARGIASQNVSNLTSADERLAEAELIAGIRHQLMTIGNRQFDGRYIFAGRDTQERPFVDALGGIAYVGDTGELTARVERGTQVTVNVPGNQLFGSLSSRIAGSADIGPNLTSADRLVDLGGATEQGVKRGQLVFNEAGAGAAFTVDLSDADTIGDVVTRINEAAVAAGSGLKAELSATGLRIVPGAEVTITDSSSGVVAASLGILHKKPISTAVEGADLGARLTRLTPVEALAGGAGIDLAGGLTITNGPKTVTVDLSTARTVQDIINTINNAGVFVLARINDAGTGIDLLNQVSGTALFVGEGGGTTATDLGVRTFDRTTPLSTLNNGRGVARQEGVTDLAITGRNGTVFEVDLDTAATIGDVIDLINAAATTAGSSVTASLAATGNGIRLTDASGTGSLSVGRANLSAAADDLGLFGSADPAATELVGGDVNPVRTEGILDALGQLEEALRSDNTQGITLAAERLEALSENVVRVHGQVGARSASARTNLEQMQDATITTQLLLSQVEDLDMASAITELQAAQVQLQADLQTSSQLLSLSLFDFIG
jgi:flagellar hook-associated protein 3 FlgL